MEDFLSKDVLREVLQSQTSFETIVVVLLLSALIGFAVAFVYKKTFRGTSYSSSYVTSLVLLCIIASIVMLVIGSNLARAFGLVGALSIIRFRTAIKDAKDISFIFLALVLGVSVGTENYHIAMFGAIFILGLIFLLDRYDFGSGGSSYFFLSIDAQKNIKRGDLEKILAVLTKSYFLNSIDDVYEDNQLERIIYKISITTKNETKLVNNIRLVEGVQKASLISSENYIAS